MVKNKMQFPNRKPIRLKEFDYSTPGAYFITICTRNRKNILSHIIKCGVNNPPKNILSKIGEIAKQELLEVEKHYNNIKIDKYVIMPNHIHLIINITERINPFPTKKFDVSNIIGKYKAAVTRNVGNAFMHSERFSLWQKSFYDHIIRNEEDYLRIWEYIDTNPFKWEDDELYNEQKRP